jgi:hypothetical protein
LHGKSRFGLGFVHSSIGRGVDDNIRLHFAYSRDNGVSLGKVNHFPINGNHLAQRR